MYKLLLAAVSIVTIFDSCSPKLGPDANWGNRRWILTELKSVPVQRSGTRRDAYIEFDPAQRRFTGNGGCNRISGNYSIEKKNGIKLGEVASTKMSCEDIAFENAFLEAMKEVTKFEMQHDILTFRAGDRIIMRFSPRTEMGARNEG
jgi:heat shock protein HslJ